MTKKKKRQFGGSWRGKRRRTREKEVYCMGLETRRSARKKCEVRGNKEEVSLSEQWSLIEPGER